MDVSQIRKFSKDQKKSYLDFLKKYKGFEIRDLYEDLYIQYELIKDPKVYFSDRKSKAALRQKIIKSKFDNGSYFYGTWFIDQGEKRIYHLLEKDKFLDFRTFRNRDLITKQEQEQLYNKKVVFIGMSVGSQVVSAFVRTGIANDIVIADADEVELHNLNRTNFFLDDLGNKKVRIVAGQIRAIDPYIRVKAKDEYITEDNLTDVIKDVDLIVDSFDNFAVKILLRKLAKKLRIPVLSGFDISKGAMVISERYDIDKDLDISFYLNGYSEKDILNAKNLSVKEKTDLFINIIGRKYHDERMLGSVLRVGKDLTGYPQLAIATNLTSSLWTLAAIDILLKRQKRSVRVYLNLEDKIYGKLK